MSPTMRARSAWVPMCWQLFRNPQDSYLSDGSGVYAGQLDSWWKGRTQAAANRAVQEDAEDTGL